MATIATFHIEGIAPYSQSKPHLTEMLPGENHDDFRKRTWQAHLHLDKNGEVFIPPSSIKMLKRGCKVHEYQRSWQG